VDKAGLKNYDPVLHGYKDSDEDEPGEGLGLKSPKGIAGRLSARRQSDFP